jgi:hypothetical protein
VSRQDTQLAWARGNLGEAVCDEWCRERADGDDVRSGSQLMLGQSVRCLASVRLRGDALVLCSAASSDLTTLAVSTRDSTGLSSELKSMEITFFFIRTDDSTARAL